MRLVCPNCDAEYEVDASAIPETGRDVQCSNCGHAWFQNSPAVEEEIAAEAALFDPPPPETPPAPSEAAPSDAPDDAEPPSAPRAIDDSILAVLREEAARETSARRAEAPPIETQDELGLTGYAQAAASAVAPDLAKAVAATLAAPDDTEAQDPVAQRITRLKGEAPPAAKPQSRREMLPEIDEINTTLRASSERRSGEAGAVAAGLSAKGASGFRTGFSVMILIALGIVALYIMAPKIAEQIPAAKAALDGFVAAVDAARAWLDATLRAATGAIGGKAS